jgi:hypothetical protein
MDCLRCRYWSDQHAELTINGTRARCLNKHSHHYDTMILGHHGCSFGTEGEAIDLPRMDRPPPRKAVSRMPEKGQEPSRKLVNRTAETVHQPQEPKPQGEWWRIEIHVRDKEGREAWRDALATQFPTRELADKLVATLRARRPKRQYRLVRNIAAGEDR